MVSTYGFISEAEAGGGGLLWRGRGKLGKPQGQHRGTGETTGVRQSAHVWYAPQDRVDFRLSVGLGFQDFNVRGRSMFASLLGAWFGLATLAGAASNPDSAGKLSRFEFVETHMGSSFKIVLYSTDAATARRASRAAFDRIAALDATLSDYQPESELSRLSRHGRRPSRCRSAPTCSTSSSGPSSFTSGPKASST